MSPLHSARKGHSERVTAASPETLARCHSASDALPGWFNPEDLELFVRILDGQRRTGVTGDLFEIGVFQGKSAVVLGFFADATDRVHVCDTFGADAELSAQNLAENDRWYGGLSEQSFLDGYTRVHTTPPTVHAVRSTMLDGRLAPRSVRFAHIDGSHTYDVVARDIALVASLMTDDGVVVIDDYRSAHTPGVAAAAWGAVAGGSLVPVALTEQKMYAAYTAVAADRLARLVGTEPPEHKVAVVEVIAGREVVTFIPRTWGA